MAAHLTGPVCHDELMSFEDVEDDSGKIRNNFVSDVYSVSELSCIFDPFKTVFKLSFSKRKKLL